MLSVTQQFIGNQIKTRIEAQFYREYFDIWRGVTPVVAAKPQDRVWAKIATAQRARRVRSVEGHTGSDVLGTLTQDLVITLDVIWFPKTTDIKVRDWFRDVTSDEDGTLSNSYGAWYTARGDPKQFPDLGITLAGHKEMTASGGNPPAALVLAYESLAPPVVGEEMPSSVLYAGTLTATTTAAPVTVTQACAETVVQADPNNLVDVFVGNSATQPVQLVPGGTVTMAVANANLVWVRSASATAVVNWLARS